MHEQTAATAEPATGDSGAADADAGGVRTDAQDQATTQVAAAAAQTPAADGGGADGAGAAAEGAGAAADGAGAAAVVGQDAAAGETGTAEGAGAAETGGRSRWRTLASWMLSALAVLLILFALGLSDRFRQPKPWDFLRLPVEPLLAVTVLLVVRPRLRPWVAGAFGVSLGLLIILKIADIGFNGSLDRPFDVVLDWGLLDDAVSFLQDSIGRAGGIAVVAGIVLLAAGLVALATLSALRINRMVSEHSTAAARSVLVLGVAWVVLAALGVQLHPNVPVADRNTVMMLNTRVQDARAALRDKQVFAAQARVDAFRTTPANQLLTGLRGKDVVLTFVESYGRSAIEDPRLAPVVDPVLDAGTQALKAAGFASRSAFLTSPTAGGGSWLAHSTLLSGLWISSQQRYRSLLASDRLSLVRCFDRAGWRTVSFEPNTLSAFPEAKSYYGYEQVYTNRDFGYRGPKFSWSRVPDQYVLQTFQNREYATPGRGPLLGEIVLTSSHSPWAPVPTMVDWNALGDGTVFGPIEAAGGSASTVWRHPDRLRAGYVQSIAYSVQSLISYVTRYGKDNLVLIFLGDHQPAPVVVGGNASRDVPITIVARDPAVLDRIAGWNWQDGINPGPRAPVWQMDRFRDRFLTAFGPTPGPVLSGRPARR